MFALSNSKTPNIIIFHVSHFQDTEVNGFSATDSSSERQQNQLLYLNVFLHSRNRPSLTSKGKFLSRLLLPASVGGISSILLQRCQEMVVVEYYLVTTIYGVCYKNGRWKNLGQNSLLFTKRAKRM